MINATALRVAVSALRFALWACAILTFFFLARLIIKAIYLGALS